MPYEFTRRHALTSLLLLLCFLGIYIYCAWQLFTAPWPLEVVPFLIGGLAIPPVALRLPLIPGVVTVGAFMWLADMIASEGFNASLTTGFCAFYLVGVPLLVAWGARKEWTEVEEAHDDADQPRRKLIGLVGYPGSGRRTAAAGLAEDGWTVVSFHQKARELAYRINPVIEVPNIWIPDYIERHRLRELVDALGWDAAEQIHDLRQFLGLLDVEVASAVGEDTWKQLLIDGLPAGPVIVPDVRTPAEADAIADAGGLLVRVERPGAETAEDPAMPLGDYRCDAAVCNTTTPEALVDDLRLVADGMRAFGAPVRA